MARFNPGDQAIINGQIVEIVSWPADDGASGGQAEWVFNLAGGGTARTMTPASIVNATLYTPATPAATVAAEVAESGTSTAVFPPTLDGAS